MSAELNIILSIVTNQSTNHFAQATFCFLTQARQQIMNMLRTEISSFDSANHFSAEPKFHCTVISVQIIEKRMRFRATLVIR